MIHCTSCGSRELDPHSEVTWANDAKLQVAMKIFYMHACSLSPFTRKKWYVVIEKCNVEVSKLIWSIHISLSRFCFSGKCYFWVWKNLIELTCVTTSFICIQDYLPEFTVSYSSGKRHFEIYRLPRFQLGSPRCLENKAVWISYFFHRPWHKGDRCDISRTWKRRFTLCFWGLNNQYVKRCENKCKLREIQFIDFIFDW